MNSCRERDSGSNRASASSHGLSQTPRPHRSDRLESRCIEPSRYFGQWSRRQWLATKSVLIGRDGTLHMRPGVGSPCDESGDDGRAILFRRTRRSLSMDPTEWWSGACNKQCASILKGISAADLILRGIWSTDTLHRRQASHAPTTVRV